MASRYRPEIDGLRAIAVVPVLLFHAAFPGFENGYLGVDIFFVISGFLIAGLLLDERERTGTISLPRFYARRIRRIIPALVVVVVATAALALAFLTPLRMQELASSIVAAFTFSANFWFWSQDVYFATEAAEQPLIHLWSLAVEEQFYVIFPILILLWVRVPDRTLQLTFVAVAVISLAISHVISLEDPRAAFFRPDTRAWEILLGVICAFWRDRNVPGFLAPAGLLLIGLSFFVLPGPEAPSLQTLPVAIGTALFLVSGSGQTGVGRLLAAAPFVWVGLISYSLYLWHQPLLAIARIQSSGTLSVSATAAILIVSFILAWATWHYVEQPARKRLPFHAVGIGAGVLSILLLSFGVAGALTHGFAFRYGDKVAAYFEAVGSLDDARGSRRQAIGLGVCHYRRDKSPPFAQFLADWACLGTGKGATILVVGDSHAADKAAAFKLNAVDVGQMTGAGCSVVPRLMSTHCREMFDFVIRRQASDCRYTDVVLAVRQTLSKRALAATDIEEALAFWGAMKARIHWFSGMPEFIDLEDRKAEHLLKAGDARIGEFPLARADAAATVKMLSEASRGRFTVIDSDALYCSFATSDGVCLPVTSKGWTAVAEGHLSMLGIYLFGQKLLALPQSPLRTASAASAADLCRKPA